MTQNEEREIKAVIVYLQAQAQKCDDHALAQSAAYDKWLRDRKGTKPPSAGALPIAAQAMRTAAKLLKTLIARKEKP
jgi:hypothetical protein